MSNEGFSGFSHNQNPRNESQHYMLAENTAKQIGKVSSTITPRETLDFQLVQYGNNKLTELATPLLGLAVRVRSMESYHSVAELHARTATEIENFTKEIENAGYDPANVLAARYCLCSMVDESVMGQRWGAESLWPERPMLSIFHNETWGGEKFFAILDRVINEADRFPDLLELLQLMMQLGFEGKYHIAHNGALKLQHLMQTIDQIMRDKVTPTGNRILQPEEHVFRSRQNMKRQMPVTTILTTGLVILLVAYIGLSASLRLQINSIGNNIQEVLSTAEIRVSER